MTAYEGRHRREPARLSDQLTYCFITYVAKHRARTDFPI